MGGPNSLQLYAVDDAQAQRAVQAAQAEVLRIEAKFSRYRDDSIVSRINAAAGSGTPVQVDDETAGLLNYAATVHEQSDGLFDITSGVLRKAWDFKAQRIPEQSELNALLPLIGWPKVQWRRPHIALPLKGMQIDFGGFGKEYAVDRAAGVLAAEGIAHGLIELGGDLRVIGPHADGSAWQVGIRHPRLAETAIATLPLHRGAIASSGDYERYFEREGRRYSHILDPRSGWPVRDSFASVSVLADQCLIAGTATTIAMLKGRSEGGAWLAALGLPRLCIDPDLVIGGSLYEIDEARVGAAAEQTATTG